MIKTNKTETLNKDITIDIQEIQRIIKTWELLYNLCSNKLENLKEIDEFLDIDGLPKLNQD